MTQRSFFSRLACLTICGLTTLGCKNKEAPPTKEATPEKAAPEKAAPEKAEPGEAAAQKAKSAQATPREKKAANKAESSKKHHHPAKSGLQVSKISPAARVFFENLKDGQKIQAPLIDGKIKLPVHFGAKGVKIQPAGKQVDNTGHHHLVIDGAAIAVGTAVPADDRHIHYGKGQTKTEVLLTPGKHRLTMQLADGFHLSYGPKYSATVNIELSPSSL